MGGRYNKFYVILSAIKRCFSRSPTHKAALDAVKCPRKKGPRGGARYRCCECKKDFGIKAIQVDHIDPIVPIGTASKDMSWDVIIERTFCDIENLQAICKDCHGKKSKGEMKQRNEAKRKAKECKPTN